MVQPHPALVASRPHPGRPRSALAASRPHPGRPRPALAASQPHPGRPRSALAVLGRGKFLYDVVLRVIVQRFARQIP